MSTQRSGASSRRWLASLAAVCTLASLAVSPVALADDPTSSTPAGSTSQQAPAAGDSQANAAGTATTQNDVDSAESTLELHGIITTNLTISKKLAITAADGTVVRHTITIKDGADGTTITGVHFKLDGLVQNSIDIADGADSITVKDCNFDAPSMLYSGNGWQHNGIFVRSDNFTADGNKFTFGRLNETNGEDPSKNEADSAEAINLVGPLKNATLNNNTFTVTAPSKDTPTDSTVSFVIANGNSEPGVENITMNNNTFTGIAGTVSRFAGLSGVSGIKGESNTIKDASHGFSVTGWQGKSDPISFGGLKANNFENVVKPGVAAEVGNDRTQYATINDAIETHNTGESIKLISDVAENVTVPAKANVTLDLNGHTLTNVSTYQKLEQVNGGWKYVVYPVETKDLTHTITNNGTLTVKDSVGGGVVDNVSHGKAALSTAEGSKTVLNGGTFKRSEEAGTIDYATGNTAANGNSYYTIENKGDMTINDGTTVQLLHKDGTPAGHSSIIDNGWPNGSPAQEGGQAKLTIAGGVIQGGKYVKNDSYGDMAITGGQIKDGANASVLNWNTLEVTGGVFQPHTQAAGIFLNQKGGAPEQGTIRVEGGTFIATGRQQVIFTSDDYKTTDALVSGGTFTNNKPRDEYLAPGFVINGNGSVSRPTPAPSEPTITGIEIASKPSKTEYKFGEAFDATGLKVNMRWSSGKKDALKPAQWTVSGFDSSKPDKVKVTVALAWDESKTASFEVTVKASDVTVRRLYNKASGEHFYTTSEQEVKAVLRSSKDWRDEGDAFTMGDWGQEVWRFYHPGSGKHMYTASAAERDALSASGWRAEGVAFRQSEGSQTKVYRLYNTGNGDHLFTTNWLEYTALRILPWWRGEGVGFNAK